jgi:hypothetical protein
MAFLVFVGLGITGCGKPTLETIEIEPAAVTIQVGQTQQLRATGRDADGQPMEDVTFSWSVDGESGQIDANGLFTAVKAGQATVTAVAEGVQGSATITVAPEPVATIATTMTPLVVVAGEQAQLTVTAQNAEGQGIADIDVQAQAETEGVTLDKTTATTDASGQAVFTVTLPPQVQAHRVRIRAGEQQTTIVVQSQAGAPATLQVQTEPGEVVAGETAEIEVAVLDPAGNPVPNTPVRWQGLSEGTTLSVREVATDDQGRASSQVQTRPAAGVNQVRVQAADLPPQEVEIVGRAGAPTFLTIRTETTETIASASVPITVQVSDRHGNPVADVPIRFTVSPAGAALDTTEARSDATGTARVVLRTSQEPGDNTVSASVANLEAVSITVAGSPPVAVHVMPSTVRVDMLGSQQFQAMAEDASGRTVEIVPTWQVVGDKGTIDPQGSFVASGLGDELVLATYAGLTGGAQVTVVPGEVASVEVTPQEVTVTAGTNYQFQAEVFNAHRYPLDVVPTWEVTDELGTIDSSGLLTATRAGEGTIVATADGQAGRAEVTVVPGPLATLQVEPEALQMRAGETIQLQVKGFDAVGNEVPVEPSWSLKADLGELGPDGTFRALRAGSGRIEIAAGPVPIVRDIPVQVEAAELVRIEVEPHTLTLSAGVEHTFTATGYDAYDNPIEVSPTWFVTEAVGDIDANGSFLARRTGSAHVQATASGISGQASVTVKPNDLARLVIQPVGPLTLTAGSTVSLTVTGFDAFGNTIAVTPDWSQTTQLGTLNAEGFFRAEKVGSGRLVARSGERTVSLPVTVVAGKLAKVRVTPTAVTLQAGNLVTFQAKGFDAYDNEVPTEPTWRVTESIGEITGTGTLTALQARSGEVIATAQGIAGKAQVTVQPGALTLMQVTPEQLSLTAGETAEILVVGYDTYGNPVPVDPVWQVTEGMGTVQDNVLTAQKAGTGRIVVAVGHLAAVIPLQVQRGELATIDIVPPTAEVASGKQQTFTVRGFDRGGNSVPVEATWAVKGDGGSITAEGVFSATQAGKSRIQASVGGLQAEAEVTVVPGAAATLQVVPETVALVAGESVSLRSEAFDAAGNRVQTAPTWTVVGDVGRISSDGVFTAQKAGTGKIVATLGDVERTVDVEVEPGPLAMIAVAPWRLVVSAGETQSFTATGHDAYGNAIAVTPRWSVQGGIGRIDAVEGAFTATTAGVGAVVAVVDTIAGLATVTVEPGAAARLQIEPAHTVLAAGESASFTVTAFDAYNNVTPADVTWDMDTALGPMEQGVLGAERAGTTEIMARSGEAEARATVQVQQGEVTRLQVVPREIEAVAGETVQLRALGFDAHENVGETAVTWELRGNIGSLTDAGVFTAGKHGQGQITARLNGVSVSIPVTVRPGPVQRLVVRPTQAQVAATMSQDFSVIGIDAGGNEQPVRALWALTSNIGQLAQTGQFLGTHTGKGTIVAYTPMALDTAAVTVQPGPVALLFVTPQPATVPAGGRVAFQAEAFDAHQNPIASLQPRWSVAGNIGTIDSQSGVFTGTALGVGKILAEVDNKLGSADVVVQPGVPDADRSRLVASRLTVPADGKTSADVIVQVQDRYGNPINNARVTLISTRDDQIDQPIPTNRNGIALGHIRSLNPGRSEIRAVIDSVRISNPLQLTFHGPGTAG